MATSIAATDSGDMEFRLVGGKEALRQRVAMHLRFQRGEFFMDETLGVPYLAEFYTRPANLPLAQQVITSAILEVEGVRSVRDVKIEHDRETRQLYYSAAVKTDYGDLAMGGAI